MKRSVCYALLAGLTLTFGGCAMPEQPRVVAPGPSVTPSQPSQIKAGDSGAGKSAHQPRSLGIENGEGVVLEEDLEDSLPSMMYVNDRIFEYGRKLDRWKELDRQSVDLELDQEVVVEMVQCFRRLQTVMNGYSSLRGKMLQSQKLAATEKISNGEILDLQKNDIAFLESACGRLLEDPESRSVGWGGREGGTDLAQLETLIERHAENGEHEEIIQVWMQIPEHQVGRVQLRTRILYANGLIYLHQEEKAIEVYRQAIEQISASREQATDLVSLRKVLADLYTASGNYREAEIQYKKISGDYIRLGRLEDWSKLQLSLLAQSGRGSDELTEYSLLLRNYLGFLPKVDGYKVARQAEKFLTDYPYSPVSANVEYIKFAAMEGADFWFNGFLAKVDKLKAEKKFEESAELLEEVPPDILDTEKQGIVEEKNQELLLAEAVDRETERMEQIQELQRQWNNGLLLVTGSRYDEALEVFTTLLDTEYSVKAEQKINEVSLQAAKADRRKAADLFIRFTKTTDMEGKKKLLIESRKLLTNILVKYPDVEIASKVTGNIERVELEMMAIDPNLILQADQAESAVDGGDFGTGLAPVNTTGNMDPDSINEEGPDVVRPVRPQ